MKKRPINSLSPGNASNSAVWQPAYILLILCAMAGLGSVRAVSAQQSSPVTVQQSGTSAVPAPQLKANLNRILGSREFQPDTDEKNWLKDKIAQARRFLNRAWERLRNWWDHLFSMSGLRAGSSLVIYVLLTFIFSGLLWLAYRVFRDKSPREPVAQRSRIISGEEEAQAEIERSPDVWLARAEEWAAKSDYRRAFRAVFLALLLELDRAGALSYDRARTNGDYLRQLRQARSQPLYDMLVPLATAFESRWYGDTPTSPNDYQTIRETYSRLPALVAATSHNPAAPELPANAPLPVGAGTTNGKANTR